MVTICTTNLTFNNSTFCPHNVCSVWISEQTAIISLYSINWLDFITKTECVYSAVRTGSLTIIHSLWRFNNHLKTIIHILTLQTFPINIVWLSKDFNTRTVHLLLFLLVCNQPMHNRLKKVYITTFSLCSTQSYMFRHVHVIIRQLQRVLFSKAFVVNCMMIRKCRNM